MSWLRIIFSLLVVLSSFFHTNKVLALEDQAGDEFITLINPVRISSYTDKINLSLSAQYSVVRSHNLPATWLLDYNVMNHQDAVPLIKGFDKHQELGILIEVTSELAEESGVNFYKADSWHRGSSLFLTGYSQADRIKIVDTLFKEFNEKFGYYPKSVGAWWIDSFSLDYMQKEYGITGALGCADQFSTDSYQLWGQYWSLPFYPNRLHAGVPANSLENKIDVVKLLWAPRDPLNGYGVARASAYSTQDYFTINLDDSYYQNLIDIYAKKNGNEFGQITLGLEGDFNAEGYLNGPFTRWVEIVGRMRESSGMSVVAMEAFSSWYKERFPNLSPAHLVTSQDLIGGTRLPFWYQSPFYRIGLVYDPEAGEIRIIDLRSYSTNVIEPYYFEPQRTLDLFINIPAAIDSTSDLNDIKVLKTGKLLKIDSKDEKSTILFDDDKSITLTSNEVVFNNLDFEPNDRIAYFFDLTKQDDQRLIARPLEKKSVSEYGMVKNYLLPEVPTFFLRKRGQYLAIGTILISLILSVVSLKLFKKYRYFLRAPLLLIIFLLSGYWVLGNKTFYIGQSEQEALMRLSALPNGVVVVPDKACMTNCSFQTNLKPSASVNKREYVGYLGKKQIVYDKAIFDAISPAEARKALSDMNAKYIYLVNYGDYSEKLPFSPDVYNIRKLYQNANTQIWEVN